MRIVTRLLFEVLTITEKDDKACEQALSVNRVPIHPTSWEKEWKKQFQKRKKGNETILGSEKRSTQDLKFPQ